MRLRWATIINASTRTASPSSPAPLPASEQPPLEAAELEAACWLPVDFAGPVLLDPSAFEPTAPPDPDVAGVAVEDPPDRSG
jgi:hypothetical protein